MSHIFWMHKISDSKIVSSNLKRAIEDPQYLKGISHLKDKNARLSLLNH